jgi:hypothetical protein
MRTMKCAELVLDFAMYPRTDVDGQHVSYIVQAMEADTEMPPVIIDKKSKRVVDGFHRIRAAMRRRGKDATIRVVEKEYRNDSALFLDAIRYNASHGRRLSTYDRSHCAINAANLGISDRSLAGALNVAPSFLGELRTDRSAIHGPLQVPIKQTIKHKKGQVLTTRQVSANKKLGGMNQLFYVNQILLLIRNELLDRRNKRLMRRLGDLRRLLTQVLQRSGRKAA